MMVEEWRGIQYGVGWGSFATTVVQTISRHSNCTGNIPAYKTVVPHGRMSSREFNFYSTMVVCRANRDIRVNIDMWLIGEIFGTLRLKGAKHAHHTVQWLAFPSVSKRTCFVNILLPSHIGAIQQQLQTSCEMHNLRTYCSCSDFFFFF